MVQLWGMEKIIFDAIDTGNGTLQVARRPMPSVAGELRIRSNDADHQPGSSRPAISKYPSELSAGYTYAPWGAFPGDDGLPNRIEMKFERVAIAGQAALKLAKLLYGNGIIYVKTADLAKTAQPERAYSREIEDFMEENQIETEWFFPQCLDWQRHWNTFSELKLSMSRKFITGLFHKEAPFCRLSKQDDSGVIRHLLYDSRFALGMHQAGTPDNLGGSAAIIPLLTWFDQRGFFDRLRGFSFAHHSRIRFGRSIYYPRPPWVGLFTQDGWMDAAADVPRIVNSMAKNQITLKYQITLEESYFKIEHPDWDSYTAEQREAALIKLENRINDKLTGPDKAYTSILSVFRYDAMQQVELGKIEIVAIDDKIKKDSWVPGAERANFEIVQGLGAHPTDFGLAREGGSMGAGSGSDKREVYNTAIDTNTIEQTYLLNILNFVFRFNQWPYKALVDHTAHTTSNLSESGQVPSKNTVQPTEGPEPAA